MSKKPVNNDGPNDLVLGMILAVIGCTAWWLLVEYAYPYMMR
jgi:hypothetical protein